MCISDSKISPSVFMQYRAKHLKFLGICTRLNQWLFTITSPVASDLKQHCISNSTQARQVPSGVVLETAYIRNMLRIEIMAGMMQDVSVKHKVGVRQSRQIE